VRKLLKRGRNLIRRLRDDWRLRRELRRRRVRDRRRTPAEVFTEIYMTNTWGGEPGTLFSGAGSTGTVAARYVETINEFIRRKGIQSVLDIGCGDFAIGQQLECADYIGVDVVAAVVERNQAEFGSDRRRFICMDAAGDAPLPPVDLCLVRQVFQHLSNAQIARVLRKLKGCQFVIVTEHHPADRDFVAANLDKVHGADTRAYFGSGVYLDRPPYNLRTELLLDCPGSPTAKGVHGRGSIRTYLITP
jgi:SAM-dependent methyltransferase